MMRVTKDPQSDLDYTVDWTRWLGTDTITKSTWIIPSGSGLSQHGAAIDDDAKKAVVWLSGGISTNATYAVVNRIETAGGRKEDFTLLVTVLDK